MACAPRKTPITVEELKAGELYGVLVKSRTEAEPLPDAVLETKLRAAEDSLEHELQLFFRERRVISEPDHRPALSPAFSEAGGDVEIPALNYPEDWYFESRWGWTELPYRPIKSVDKFFFSYPGTAFTESYTYIPEWVRLDKKFGRFYIVPTKSAGAVTLALLNNFILSILGTGRGLPQTLFIDYTAGFSPEALKRDHNDLLELVRLTTTLLVFGILGNVRSGGLGNQSLSQDGQSRSQSIAQGKFGPYSGAIELANQNIAAIKETWRRSERGISMCFV